MPKRKDWRQEAGKKGGAATKGRHGPTHYSAIGQKGGAKVREELGQKHFQKAGRRGGQATKQKGREHFQQLAAASAKSRAARAAVLPGLLAALAPFEGWLDAVRGVWQQLQAQGKGTPEDGCTLHPASQGLTFGDCARLLQALRAAQGKPATTAEKAAEHLEVLRKRLAREDDGPHSSQPLGNYPALPGAPVRELTVVPDDEAPAPGGE